MADGFFKDKAGVAIKNRRRIKAKSPSLRLNW